MATIPEYCHTSSEFKRVTELIERMVLENSKAVITYEIIGGPKDPLKDAPRMLRMTGEMDVLAYYSTQMQLLNYAAHHLEELAIVSPSWSNKFTKGESSRPISKKLRLPAEDNLGLPASNTSHSQNHSSSRDISKNSHAWRFFGKPPEQ